MSNNQLGQRIADPRLLSDELGDVDPTHPDMYSNLATYTFGAPRPSLSPYDVPSEEPHSISPLTLPRLSPDRTPRPSVSSHPFLPVSSHPSQGAGRPASSHYASSSQSRRHSTSPYSAAVGTSGSRSPAVSGSDSERSEDPTSSTDPIIAAYFSPHRGSLMSDTASQHTFGHASLSHGFTAASSQDGAAPSSSSVSVATSRSSSRTSMRTPEQFSSDDELDFDCYEDGNSSPVIFARYDLVDIDEDADLIYPRPASIRSSFLDGRRGSLPMAIPGALQASDAYSARSREGSILTVRRPSRSWDDSSTHRSSHSGEDPTLILPKSEPLSRADWHSLEVQLQAKQQQQQVVDPGVYDGLDLQYILSKHSEGSIHSVGSRLSFVQGISGPSRSSPHLFRGAGSTTTLPFEDTFMKHLQKHDRGYDTLRYFWSFVREKADAPSSSSRRRQQVHHHRTGKSRKEPGSRVQEMWRCGHVGRFKVDKLVFKRTFIRCLSFDSTGLIVYYPSCDPHWFWCARTAQSADPTKGAQQRIHVRHIPDPFLMGNTTSGPHSVIHKHSRAAAFSIFRCHGLFSGRHAGGTGAGPSSAQTHMNMRLAIMLAPKKVQEQYTSTKTTKQLNTYGLLDNESRGSRRGTQSLPLRERGSRDKERRRGQEKAESGKGKVPSKGKGKGKGKGKDKGDKKHRRANLAESTESSSAGSVTNSAIKHVISAPDRPMVKIHLPPSISSATISRRDSASRPASPTSPQPPSIIDSTYVPDSETSSIQPIRLHRDHRDSLDLEDRFPTRTTHAEAFSALDPNDIESLRAKASSRPNADSGSTFTERFLRVFRGSSRTDDHPSNPQPRAFQPPWLVTAGRDLQEENDRVLNDLNASFRDVGLLHTNPHKSSKAASKRKSSQGILDQIPDDCLYMLLPLWPGESDTASVRAETNSAASFITIPENRQYLLVYYVPFREANSKPKKPEKKRAKLSHSSDSGVEADPKAVYLPAFRAVARVVTYDELRFSGVRVPSDGLAINGPEWEAVTYSACVPLQDAQVTGTVVCQCLGRDSGFDFLEDGLLKLGLCTREEFPPQDHFSETEFPIGETILTPIGRAAVEMIWLGCLAITTFGPT
ncbi:hypothetical protein HD554DRAFT_2312434 [Boletus coccyginus]|nr:hypothetical protein HD554DRAFT_2312434 [Boletus coccyginus]